MRQAQVAGAIGWWRKMVRSGSWTASWLTSNASGAMFWLTPRSARSLSLPPRTIMLGLQDRTNDPIDAIVDDLVSLQVPGVAILDPAKQELWASGPAIAVKPKRAEAKIANLITEAQFKEGIEKCTQCNECAFCCPPHIRISKPHCRAVTRQQSGILQLL